MTCKPQHGAGTGCCCGGHTFRLYLSKEEKIHQLEHYVEELKKEITEAEKRLQALKEDDGDNLCCYS